MKTKPSFSKWARGQRGRPGSAPRPLHVYTFYVLAEQMGLPEFLQQKARPQVKAGEEGCD